VESARKLGVPPGGDIMIHGLPNGFGWMGALHTHWDWTNGCIAVTNPEIEEIWSAVPNGTPIEIRP
jgi:murein L,D-transpeptidase YafK